MSEPTPDDVPLRLRTVPASQGAVWVRHGFRVIFRRPMAFCLLLVLFMVFAELLTQLSVIGVLALLGLLPLVSLGFMIATRRALEGTFPTPRVFIAPLQRGRPQTIAQAKLGVAYAAAFGAISLLGHAIGGAAFDALRQGMASGMTPEALQPLMTAEPLQTAMLLMSGLLSLLAVPFWHAPALVHWDRQGAAKALFSSTLACWRNKGALTIYTITWIGVVMTFMVVALIVFTLLGVPQYAAYSMAPAMLLFMTAYYASLYFSFADSFERHAPDATRDSP